jgi:hypothetical protein
MDRAAGKTGHEQAFHGVLPPPLTEILSTSIS